VDKTINIVFAFLAVLSGLLLLFVTFSICFNIFARYLGFAGIIWGVQFTEYSMLWMTLLGAAWVLQRDRHVSVDLLTNQMGPQTKAYLAVVHSIMGVVLCGVLCWYGTLVTWGQYQRGVTDIQVVDMPKYLVLIVIPGGFLFLTLQFLRKFFESLKNVRVERGEASG
jgi:TRAP-type C4-dicarboxylate transport system permease small subunit